MDFTILKEVSNLHNMHVTGEVEKKEVVDKVLENKEAFDSAVGLTILLIVVEVRKSFINEFPEFCEFVYEKITANQQEFEGKLSIWDSIKMFSFLESYESNKDKKPYKKPLSQFD